LFDRVARMDGKADRTPFNVIQGHLFWYQSKAIFDFTLVNNISLHPVSCCSKINADY